MSNMECNVVSAGGDGLKRSVEKPRLRRTPVPSSRKLATRPQVQAGNVKLKLEEALNQLSSPKQRTFCRKRAQTMAEITPSKRKPAINSRLSGDEASKKSPSRKEDASRRVYHQLLLNAWRRRRVQVATLTDSSRRLQTQVDQLQIQVDVLQKLRESESQKRLESASETERLRHEKDGMQALIENLEKERKCLEDKVVNLQRRMEEIDANATNIKNELLTAKSEMSSYELELKKEQRNGALLGEENQNLLNRIEEYKTSIVQNFETIHNLEEALETMEKNLETANLNNSTLEETKSELEIKLDKEKEYKDDLEEQFTKSRIREEKLEKKIYDLKKSANLLNLAKRKILQDNFALRKTLEELELSLKEEKDKIWWKSAAKIMLNTLHNAAYMMLPAYSRTTDTYHSTCSHE